MNKYILEYKDEATASGLHAMCSLVACTWVLSAPVRAHRVLPDGCIDIVVIDGRARVVGTMQRAIMVRPLS